MVLNRERARSMAQTEQLLPFFFPDFLDVEGDRWRVRAGR